MVFTFERTETRDAVVAAHVAFWLVVAAHATFGSHLHDIIRVAVKRIEGMDSVKCST